MNFFDASTSCGIGSRPNIKRNARRACAAVSEPAEPWAETEAHLLRRLDRLVERGDQLEALAALETVHERGAATAREEVVHS